MLDLAHPPADVTDRSRWLNGEPGPVGIGDLWLLSWDGIGLGLAIISGIADDYVLVWPATFPSQEGFRPAIELPSTRLGTTLFVWPSRETGVGLHLLHRRFGTELSQRTMALMLDAVENGTDSPYPYAPLQPDDPTAWRQDAAMVDQWEDICLNVWPEPVVGEAPLNREVLRSHGITVGDLAGALRLAPQAAASLFLAEAAPSPGQVETVARQFGLDRSELLAPLVDESVLELLSPVWKDDVLAVARRLHSGEAVARQRLREEYALAARASGPNARRDRMTAAVQRILRDEI
ncbi:helix-turn-helix domain-containing protein [Kribbella sp. NPDC050470]|uniref:helix-turn-helix domain-containing protein n=1 Tax=unclassified Kribbella TaxID=2644121 RepID=UPI0037BD7698